MRRKRFILSFTAVLLVLVLALGGNLLLNGNKAGKADAEIPMLMSYRSVVKKDALVLQLEEEDLPHFTAEGLCVSNGDEAGNLGSVDEITAEAAILYDMTDGTVLFSKNAEESRYPASVTKLMTFLTAMRFGNLSDKITVEYDMLKDLDPESSVAGLNDGDLLTLEQLLYGLMLPSGNDAACAIAWCVAGDEASFVDLMNETARQIGCTDSHFMNPHGLTDEAHFTSPYDIYLIFRELLSYDIFLDVITAQKYTADYVNIVDSIDTPVRSTWERGIWYFNGKAEAPAGVTPIGGKTGTTPEAGYCLALMSENEDGNRFLSVILHAGSRAGLYENMTALLEMIP